MARGERREYSGIRMKKRGSIDGWRMRKVRENTRLMKCITTREKRYEKQEKEGREERAIGLGGKRRRKGDNYLVVGHS